ncbi:MAG TPA: DUF92 domain-containing protein [Vicinamibacterales bacterium]|jgi:uncharacterized protein (TIGR00297 family)|nr:DUF92 domain-containing protein [Vicinamibacterales bacterium]
MSHSEHARQWVHAGSGLFALLLRVLIWWQAAALAATALAFNVFVLPRIGGRRLYRPVDEARGFPLGIVLYPLSVLLLILLFPSRLDIVAAAWGILAFGDGFATLVGQRAAMANAQNARTAKNDVLARFAAFAGRGLPWNREKTVAGTIAFMVCGGYGASALAVWTRPAVVPTPEMAFVLVAPLVAAIIAGLVETIPIRLDDNISVPMTAAAVLWLASLITPETIDGARVDVLSNLPWAIGVNAAVSYLGYRARTVSLSGTIGGALIGIVIYAAGGWRAWLFLFLTFFVATAASKLGLKRKVLLGIEEERGGRRGAGNAFANCGVAAAAALAAVTTAHRPDAWLAFVAALTAGGSDTVASEIGKAWGKSTFLVTGFGRVKAGTPGAMSLEGTTAGVVSAFALATVASALGLIPGTTILAVVVGATVGALVESVLAATLEGPGILNNDMLNFINTAVGAAVAIAIA